MAEESLGRAVLELVANVAPLSAGLKEGKMEAESMARTTSSGMKNGITKAALPAALAVAGVAIALHKSVDAAEANQTAEAKLAAAFKASGQNIDDYKGSIDKAEASSASLGFKSEDVKAALGQLVVATHNGKQAIDMLSTAQNVARFKGISLVNAGKLLTTTMAGSARAAHALGIVLPPVTTATDQLKSKTKYASNAAYEHAKATAYMSDKQATAQKMIGLLNDKLGGQADAFSKTAEGAKEKMGAEFQILEINIGNVLIPVLTRMSEALASASQWMTKHATIAKIVLGVLGLLGSAILLINLYMKLATAATAAWDAVLDANPITIIIIAIAALVIAIIELWKHSQTFRDIVLGVWKDVQDATQSFVDFFTQTVPGAFHKVVDWVKSNWEQVIFIALTGPFGLILSYFGADAHGIVGAITGAFHDVIHWFENVWTDVKGLIKAPYEAIADAAGRAFGIPGDIHDAFVTVKGWFGSVWSDVEGLIKAPFNALKNGASDGFGLGGILSSAWKDIKGAAETALGKIGSAAKDALTAPINALISILDGFDIHFGGVSILGHHIGSFDWHPFNIPQLADGGIVNSPTLALIGEAGPEAVVPLGKGGVGGVTVNVSGVVGNERDVALRIGRELQKLNTSGIKLGLV